MQQSRNYKRDSQSECKQALEIWPESGASRVSAYREAVALVQAQDAVNLAGTREGAETSLYGPLRRAEEAEQLIAEEQERLKELERGL